MTDTEMHNKFPDKFLRDYFSNTISEVYWRHPKKEDMDSNLRGIDFTIDRLRKELAFTQAELKRAENLKALQDLMSLKGWKEFDVSDEIKRSGEHYKNFIGTQEEYDYLMKQLSLQKYIGQNILDFKKSVGNAPHRIVEKDGEKFIMTMDLNLDRYNLVVEDGIVKDIYFG